MGTTTKRKKKIYGNKVKDGWLARIIPSQHKSFHLSTITSRRRNAMIYKLISKVLMANRLKPSLKRIISPMQMAIVPWKTVKDNYILAHEISRSMKWKKGSSGWVATKIDRENASDTWD